MVDGDPDIDAIHRLIFKKPPTFVHNEPLLWAKTYVLLIRKIVMEMQKHIPLLYLPAAIGFVVTSSSYVAH